MASMKYKKVESKNSEAFQDPAIDIIDMENLESRLAKTAVSVEATQPSV